MKRDMNVIRKLILFCETAENGTGSDDIDLDVDDDVLDYHLRLMDEAGLIKTQRTNSGVLFIRMTWTGHDFADACRDDVVWKRTMRTIAEKTKSVTFDVPLHVLKGTLTTTLLG